MPHPQGDITVNYELKENRWEIEIDLPGDLSGTFLWKDKSYRLNPGKNAMVF